MRKSAEFPWAAVGLTVLFVWAWAGTGDPLTAVALWMLGYAFILFVRALAAAPIATLLMVFIGITLLDD